MKIQTWVFSALLLTSTGCSKAPQEMTGLGGAESTAALSNVDERPSANGHRDLTTQRYLATYLGDVVPQQLSNDGEVVGLQKAGFGAFYYKLDSTGNASITDLNLPDCAYELGIAGQRARHVQISDSSLLLVTDQRNQHYFYNATQPLAQASCDLSIRSGDGKPTGTDNHVFLNGKGDALYDRLSHDELWRFWQWDPRTLSRTQLAKSTHRALGEFQMGRPTAFNRHNSFVGSLLHRANASGCYLYQGHRNGLTLLEEPGLNATGSVCRTTKLTDSGYIIGHRRTETNWRDYLWLPFNKGNTEAYSSPNNQSDLTPFSRRKASATDGHWLPGKALDVSNAGLVVGYYDLGRGETSAYAFNARSGNYVDLNSHRAAGHAEGWHFTKAVATNDRGDIVVQAQRQGDRGVPETGAFLLRSAN